MIDKININPIRFDDSSSGEARPRQTGPVGQQGDATLQVNFDRLMEQARKMPADDTEIVHKAQELLRSGLLDTAANIKEAAENIVKFGI
jgi:SAM-dependent MidA family methyltransferase